VPDQFDTSRPVLPTPEEVAEARLRDEYLTGGEYVYLDDGRRCVHWDLVADAIAVGQSISEADVALARMQKEWGRTGEVRGIIELHPVMPEGTK
jgi:hypothetical protein